MCVESPTQQPYAKNLKNNTLKGFICLYLSTSIGGYMGTWVVGQSC